MLTVNAAWNIFNFRRPLVEALLDDGYQVTILAPSDESVGELEVMGCRFEPLEMDVKGLSPVKDFLLALTFLIHFRRLKPDAVLSYTIKNNLFGSLAARILGIPFIPNVTGLGTAFLSSGFLLRVAETLYRVCFAGLPVVFFQNEDDRALFIKRGLIKKEQAQLLPGSGIDLDAFPATPLPVAEAPLTFLLIARLLRDKGVVEFVDAARMVKIRYPDARFQLLGPMGSENRTAIEARMVEAWVAEGVVDYLGETKNVKPFIAGAHCVVLPSYREGAPRTLIEAAAMARPLIATDVPGCRAVVDEGKTGFFCDVKSAESLAKACEAFILLDRAKQEALGAAGRTKMEAEYDQALVVKAYRAALAGLADQH